MGKFWIFVFHRLLNVMEGAEGLEGEGAEKLEDELEGAQKDETTARVKRIMERSILPCGEGQTSAVLLLWD